MSEQFKLGEVVIVQNLPFQPWLNGAEVEIVGGLAVREWRDRVTAFEGESLTYEVR